jgi:two-component system sensor histidine kinase MtrB
MPSQIPTGRFRWRLTIAFILVSGISAGILAGGSYFLVSRARNDTFLDRSLRDSQVSYSIAERDLERTVELNTLIFDLKRQTGAGIVAVTADEDLSSDPHLGAEDIPQDLATIPGEGSDLDLRYADVETPRGEYLVVTSVAALDGLDLYFFYPRESLNRSMSDLAAIMLRLWLGVVFASALVGTALARRTLHPVARAGAAARDLAEGLLDTRLPVEREDEFGAWAVSFNEMADALQQKISELTRARERERQFTSDVAHELRTPLTALVSSASMVDGRLDQMSPDARWAAERMIAEVRRLRALVDELMEISRLHSGRESIRTEPVDLAHLVRHVISSRKWDGLVSVEGEGEGVYVITDRRRLERIITNLLSNAFRHGEKDVRVKTGSHENSAFVEVSDQGPGIAPEFVDNIFDRFYKVDPARPGGSGLGLSIAAENARLLGGTIDVETEPGEGARFTVTIPSQEQNGLSRVGSAAVTRG